MSRLTVPFAPTGLQRLIGMAGAPLARVASASLALALLAACAQNTVPAGPTPAQETAERRPIAETEPRTWPPEPETTVIEGPRETATVALIVPLTGPSSDLGRDLLDAAQLALFDVADDRFEMRVYDSGGTGFSAQAAAERARGDRAQLIVGPLLSGSVTGAAEVARAADIPMLTFSNNSHVAEPGVWTLGYLPEGQIGRVVDFARRRGMRTFATLAPDDPYGARMTEAFTRAVLSGIGEVADRRYYLSDTESMSTTIRALGRFEERKAALRREVARLKKQDDPLSKRALERLSKQETLGDVGFEALFLPAGGEAVLQLAPLLAFYDVDPGTVKLLGTWLWDDPALGTEPAMVGAWFAAPPPSARQSFLDRFANTYGREPGRLATLGYDAMAMAAVLARRDGPQGDPFASGKLTNPEGFTGADGLFRLLPSGLNERGLAVLEVRREGPAVLDPAPATFDPVVN